MLAYISIGDRIQDIERLVGALGRYPAPVFQAAERPVHGRIHHTPQVVGHAAAGVLLGRRKSCRCAPPPGASAANLSCVTRRASPILAPGEVITQEIIDYIEFAKAKGCSMQGPESSDISELNVLKEV